MYCPPRIMQRHVCFRVAVGLLCGGTPRLWRQAIKRALLEHATARAIEGSALDG
jgi:hypothetical protein